MQLEEKVRRLKQLRYLKREADQLDRRLGALGSGGGGEALRRRMEARRARCLAQLGALTDFIDGVDDSLTRQILACRYIDGYTWRGVAACIGERDEQYPRRLHNRFLRERDLPKALAEMEEGEGEGRSIYGTEA